MSWQAATFVTENSKHKGSYLLTLLMIANHAHADGTGAWPSIATLAQGTRLSERAVQYCIQKLKESGEIEVIPDGGPKGVNGYRIIGMTQTLRQTKSGMTQDSALVTQDLSRRDATAIAPERKERSLEKSSKLDDLKKSFLSKCTDPGGVIAAMVEIICERAAKSGIAINSEAYLLKATENFDTRGGQDCEDLAEFMRRGAVPL